MTKPEAISLPSSAIRLRFDASRLSFADTSRLPEPDRLTGQSLAVEAIEFALGVDSGDFHLFAAGPPGVGRATIVRAMADRAARRRPIPQDFCCIYNFDEPARPLVVGLPAGSGRVFAAEMNRLVDFMSKGIPTALTSRDYRGRQQQILEGSMDARRDEFGKLEVQARELGIGVEDTPSNLQLLPLNEAGEPMAEEEYEALTETERKGLEERERSLRDDILEYLDLARGIQDRTDAKLEDLDRTTVTRLIEPRIGHIKDVLRFADVHSWLDDMLENILETLESFLPADEHEGGLAEALRGPRAPAERYDVNIVVDNSKLEGAPVVLELNPTYSNLVGKVERRVSFGAIETNHMLVRAGALHRANGGILIVDASELVSHPNSYPALKRALREGACTIEDPDEFGMGMSTMTLHPQPIPIRTQIVLLGSLDDYIVLRELDTEFAKLVKVRADFDSAADLTDEHAHGLACFTGSVCRERSLRHFTAEGVAALIEVAARMAGRKDEVSLRLDAIRSVIVEADYWASTEQNELVDRVHVERARDQALRRSSLYMLRTLREFERKNLLIAVDGRHIGQVNGLAVLGVGDILFGMPARITAKTFVGEAGLVHIERETELSGQIHSKATLILHGYVGWRYARSRRLALSASITFEQNYSSIDGDSASIAEVVALLSSLSDVPVRQDLAVTGSMSQHGEAQPIGGVNEKVEGFFRVCALDGLTGTQGVVIPVQNVTDLNLADDVADAVERGEFHIYSVSRVEQALSLMLGVDASASDDGSFGPGSVHEKVAARLDEMAAAVNSTRE